MGRPTSCVLAHRGTNLAIVFFCDINIGTPRSLLFHHVNTSQAEGGPEYFLEIGRLDVSRCGRRERKKNIIS